jgi:ribosomal protein L7/L12
MAALPVRKVKTVNDYLILKRIVLSPRHVDTGFTKHYAQGQLQATPHALEIVQYPGQSQVYLFNLDSHDDVQNDTFHESVDDAVMQASLEFLVSPDEWEFVEESTVGDAAVVPDPSSGLETQSVSVAQIRPGDPQPRVDVYLAAVGPKALHVMQVLVESVPGIGLRAAKFIVDHAPCKICSDAPTDWASEIGDRLESFGAKVDLRPAAAGGPSDNTLPM